MTREIQADVTGSDYNDEVPTFNYENEMGVNVRYYPTVGAAKYGTLMYTDVDRSAIHDVTGFEVVDYDLAVDDGEDGDERFEEYNDEYMEWVGESLLTSGRGPNTPSTHFDHEGRHQVKLTNPYEGDEITIDLHVENRRQL